MSLHGANAKPIVQSIYSTLDHVVKLRVIRVVESFNAYHREITGNGARVHSKVGRDLFVIQSLEMQFAGAIAALVCCVETLCSRHPGETRSTKPCSRLKQLRVGDSA